MNIDNRTPIQKLVDNLFVVGFKVDVKPIDTTPQIDFEEKFLELRNECIKLDIQLNGKQMNFGQALERLKRGQKIAREGWNNPNIWIELQEPDEFSKMTKPYLYMVKYDDKFPCDMSCESVLAEDWQVVE